MMNCNINIDDLIGDAEIVSPGKNEDVSCEVTDELSRSITKIGFVNPDSGDVEEFFRNAGTVYFGTGTAKTPTS